MSCLLWRRRVVPTVQYCVPSKHSKLYYDVLLLYFDVSGRVRSGTGIFEGITTRRAGEE